MKVFHKPNRPELLLAVVIPTHNRWEELHTALSCLKQSDYGDFEIVVIDDGSTDGTAEHCRREFPDVHLLHGDGKLWWSGAINKGMDFALNRSTEAIVWLNDDNRVEPDTLSRLVESFKRLGEQSIICARTKSTGTGSDEWVGDPPRWHPEFGLWTPPDLSSPEVLVKHPPGGRGVLIPAHCIRKIGLVGSRAFPHYWADHDFHYRAMKAGYQYYLATGAIVWNVPNVAREDLPEQFSPRWGWRFIFSRRSPMNVITLRRLLKKHLSPQEYRAAYFPLLWHSLTWLASGWAARKPTLHRSLRAIKRGLLSDRRS